MTTQRKHDLKQGLLIVVVSLFGFYLPLQANASPTSLDLSGSVTVEDGGSSIVDPENPEEEGDPGEGPSTTGPLRIDYVSTLDFGRVRIPSGTRQFQALGHQLKGVEGPRGSYLQLTDQRSVSTGWTVQVKQSHQFRDTSTRQELTGAVLSLDQAWANSSGASESPTVTRETVALNGIGAAYELATAKPGSGQGVWTIAFGASNTNTNNQNNTMTPAYDAKGQRITDIFSGKPAYYNSVIQLMIPVRTNIQPITYETEVTWILAALP